MTTETVTALPTLPPRSADSNKGDFGRVLVVAGSRGMSGAAILCASAAMRAGAGLVKIAVPSEILPIVAGFNPCYMTVGLPQDEDGHLAGEACPLLANLAQTQDVVAIGPGLGRSAALPGLVAELVAAIPKPMVIDADGLNALAGCKPLTPDPSPGGRGEHAEDFPRIITPHPGEFARLLQIDTQTVQSQRRELAVEFARRKKCIVVLKGHGTIVTDGQRVYQNTTGNPGLAKGGTGDVLTGIIAALLGQHLPPFEAAQLGVYVHGLAGDIASEQIGEVSLLATDVLDFLPAALRMLAGRSERECPVLPSPP